MKISKRQLKRIIREARRSLADNQYAYEGDDVGPGEIPADYHSKLYSALSPIGFETGLDPDSKYFKHDILDAMITVERELKKAGFKNPQIVIDHITPMLADIVREHPGAGGYRTDALVDAISFDVFNAAAGGPFGGYPAPKYAQSPMWDEEEDSPPMISDSYKAKGNKMKISKRQLKRIIREEAQLLREMNEDGSSSGNPVVDILTRGLLDAGIYLDHEAARMIAEELRLKLANTGLLREPGR